MGLKSALTVGIAVVAVIAGGAYFYKGEKAHSSAHIDAHLATPAGVTFQRVKVGTVTMVPGASSDQQEQVVVYADGKGKTAYVYDKDTTPGKSACTEECAKTWIPLTAPADAKPVDEWSVIARDDGSKQWAHKGKPLYSFANDKLIGDSKGNNADAVWHMALLSPADGMALPYGIAVQEVAEAAGQVIVDAHGMPLYLYDGDVKTGKVECASGPCGREWRPLTTGQLSNAIGDFTVIDREDGIQQWAYKGYPLFTYSGDSDLGDANGQGADKNFQIAMIEHYFLPPGVKIILNERKGGLLASADGKTLYARDRISFNGTGGHSARGGDRGNPMVGMTIGLSGCDGDCTKSWIPLLADKDAQPSGYWMLMDRPDGTRQWAYQGYAVYNYTGDRKPGDTIGQDTYNLAVNDGPDKVADARHGMGLYWRTTSP
jgi:predicted lipoprotein with Yx(FWY)xxD motif